MIRKLLLLLALAVLSAGIQAQYVTVTGTFQGTNGIKSSNYTLSFTLSQWGFVAGTGVQVPNSSFCATSTDGSVVGLGNPLSTTAATVNYSGTLPAGNYYVQYGWYAGSTKTLLSPEMVVQLTSSGQIIVPVPASGLPAGAGGMGIYIGTSSGTETLQGVTVGMGTFIQSIPLVTGAAVPTSNTTVCQLVANDVIWPVGTGYAVSVANSSGNSLPGYPMMWQLLGAGTTINVSNGLPYYRGVVTYPVPILASPLNHATQSISGGLSFTGYSLYNVRQAGIGTGTPGYGVDVQGAAALGAVNALSGYLYNGAAPNGHALVGNGTYYVDTPLSYSLLGNNPYIPAVAPGSGLGVGGTATLQAGSNDAAGAVVLNTGTGASGGTWFTFTPGGTYATTMFCSFSMQNSFTYTGFNGGVSFTTTATVGSGSVSLPSTTASALILNYVCLP